MKSLTTFGIRPGLERITYLLQQLGQPQKAFPCVHIAGTNGKGTVTEIISQGLQDAGHRVGKFTSPHLHDYTERIQINNKPIRYTRMNQYLDKIADCVPQMLEAGFSHPTEFEVLTAVALTYFQEQQVDVAVLEVGLGGTWDSTNVVTPELSVITGVDYDHMQILGNTLEEIAANKAGIIKPGVPLVIGAVPEAAAQVIYRTAQEKQASVIRSNACQVDFIKASVREGQILRIQGVFPKLTSEVPFALLGSYQRDNLATALTALAVLQQQGWHITAKSLRKTLQRVFLPGRLEVVSRKPLVLMDVAHNPQGAAALGDSLQELFPQKKKVLLCGILDDKDAEQMMKSLAPHTRQVIFTQPLGARGIHWQRLKPLWETFYPDIPAAEEADIQQAVALAKKTLQKGEYLLITGSFYLMDPARKCFVNPDKKKR